MCVCVCCVYYEWKRPIFGWVLFLSSLLLSVFVFCSFVHFHIDSVLKMIRSRFWSQSQSWCLLSITVYRTWIRNNHKNENNKNRQTEDEICFYFEKKKRERKEKKELCNKANVEERKEKNNNNKIKRSKPNNNNNNSETDQTIFESASYKMMIVIVDYEFNILQNKFPSVEKWIPKFEPNQAKPNHSTQ